MKCNYVYSHYYQAIRIAEFGNTPGKIDDLNLDIKKVETGDITDPIFATTAISTHADGFIKINEVNCKILGHCLSHQEGSLIAQIFTLTSTTNRSGAIATLHIPGTNQGIGNQELVLYFDAINAFEGTLASGYGIEFNGGRAFLIGRKIYSDDGYVLSCGGVAIEGFVKCSEMIGVSNYAVNFGNSNTYLTINANLIESNFVPPSGFSPVISLNGTDLLQPKLIIKNTYIKNKNSASNSKGIYFEDGYSFLELNNVKIVAGSGENNIIFLGTGSQTVKNYGLFGNNVIDDNITLQIGDDNNDLFIVSQDLTN